MSAWNYTIAICAAGEVLEKFYHVKPLPSERTIARILARAMASPMANRHLPMIKAQRSLPGVALSSGQARILYDVVTQKQ